jgi:hypothetical protein
MLAVSGVIGVTLRQSFFQRRSGLITVIATTAAGAQRYEVPDVPLAQSFELAEQLVPESAGLRGTGRWTAGEQAQPGHPVPALLRDGQDESRLPA